MRILLSIYFSLFSLRLIQQYTSANGRGQVDGLEFQCTDVCMFVCLSDAYTRLIEPRSIHVLYMGRSGIYRPRFLSKNQLRPNNASSFTSENVRNSHIFLQFFS